MRPQTLRKALHLSTRRPVVFQSESLRRIPTSRTLASVRNDGPLYRPRQESKNLSPTAASSRNLPSTGFQIRADSQGFTVGSSSAQEGDQEVPALWLRDNCQCTICVHQDTKQRNFDAFEISADLSLSSVNESQDGYTVSWSDGHESFYARDWLTKIGVRDTINIRQGRAPNLTLWDVSYLSQNGPPSVSYEAVMDRSSDEGMKTWVTAIRNFGFCYVDDTPAEPAKTQELLERIAYIRETHYGGFYDFTADLASKDTAYTSIALPAHTDNTYFSDPSGLQAFHLLSHTEGEGGASLLVDGFAAAAELKRQDPEAYEVLSKVPVQFHASGNEGISIQPYQAFPILVLDPVDQQLVQVRWNESDRAALQLNPAESQRWYNAARKFDSLLKSSRFEYWEQLKPGRVSIFDNWRVLHGRSEFTGKRRICGGYINRDDYISRFKMLYYGQDEVRKHINVGA